MSTLMLILFLVVVLVPGVVLLGLGRANTGDQREPGTRPHAEPGELPEILRRPLRARL